VVAPTSHAERIFERNLYTDKFNSFTTVTHIMCSSGKYEAILVGVRPTVSSFIEQALLTKAPFPPNQASEADQQFQHSWFTATVHPHSKRRRNNRVCKSITKSDFAPNPRLPPRDTRQIQLPLLAPKQSFRLIYDSHTNDSS
jgi:hypothetical protein